jgi:hypothetical protein
MAMSVATALQGGIETLRVKLLEEAAELELCRLDHETGLEPIATLGTHFFYTRDQKDARVTHLRIVQIGDATTDLLFKFTHARLSDRTWVVRQRYKPTNAARIWSFELEEVEQ